MVEPGGSLVADAAASTASSSRRLRAWRRALALSRPRAVLLLTVASFSAPALIDLLSDARRAPFRWLAADTFYYLTVGRNVARHGVVAFDGVHPSNGFHPLWQAVSVVLESLREQLHLGPIAPLLHVLVGLVAISVSIWLLGLTLHEERRLTPLFLGLPVGLYALLVLPAWALGLHLIRAHGLWGWLLPVFGSLWSYANGMESGVTILAFAAALRLGAAPATLRSSPRAWAFGGSLGFMTLARLDHGLLALTLWLGFVLLALRKHELRRGLEAGLALALPVVPYLLLNRHFFGSIVPLSGVAKSSFPHVTSDNWDRVLNLWRGQPSHAATGADSHWWLPVACRELQTLLPIALCVGYLVFRAARRSASSLQLLLSAAAVGSIALGAYNFCFTKCEHQGFWYYPVSTLLPSLFVLAEPWRLARLRPPLRLAGFALLQVGVVGFFLSWHRHPRYNEELRAAVLDAAAAARLHYGGKPPRILEIDDGCVGYGLDTPAMSVALALDPEGQRALSRNQLLELALSRGFDHVATAMYLPGGTSPADLANWVGATLHQDVSAFSFEKDLLTEDGRLLIVKVSRR